MEATSAALPPPTPLPPPEPTLESTTLDLGHSRLDLDRGRRCGYSEVVFGAGKTEGELRDIARALLTRHGRLLVTRVEQRIGEDLCGELAGARYHPRARLVTAGDLAPEGSDVLVVSAGTADEAVAREACLCARFLGAPARQLRDVGVAGVHRLLEEQTTLRAARVLIVVAGMEGALPSVVGGLVDRPVIAVPTSVGYGAAFEGLAALLGMLNSCTAGVTVVNIDNGFGAGYAAAQILRTAGDAR